MRNGIPEHDTACFCEECMEHAISVANGDWEQHQRVCKIESADRHLVPYHTDPQHPGKYPDQLYCSACNLVIFMKALR